MDNNEKDVAAEFPVKQKMSRKKKIIITVSIIVGVLLALGLAAWIAFNVIVDDLLDLISYDDGNTPWSTDVDIDASDYGIEDNISYDMSFEDPEASADMPWDDSSAEPGDDTSDSGESESGESSEASESGNSSSGGTESSGGTTSKPKPVTSEKPYEPNTGILSGLFDDDEINRTHDADVINILLIGADIRSTNGLGTGRSDTMILMSINKKKEQITFTSLMRDLYVDIEGYLPNRLNAAHSAGGPKLLMETIEKNFGIPVDYYVRVNFASFKGAVDAIGGIDITVNSVNYDHFKTFSELKGLTKAEATDGSHVIHLNGTKALVYARNRSFASADFTRTLHQRDLLSQVLKNLKGSSLSELHEMLKTVLPYVVTNIPKDMLKMMVFDSIDYISYEIQTLRIPVAGTFKLVRRRGMSVIDFMTAENKKKNCDTLYSAIYGD